jgi:tetrahydromethanopterin S-methyltransferase subunit G
MANNENTPEHDEPENVGLVYLRRIDARLDSIERKLDEVVVRLATVEQDVAAMRVRLDSLDGRVARIQGRVDMQREIAKLAAALEP